MGAGRDMRTSAVLLKILQQAVGLVIGVVVVAHNSNLHNVWRTKYSGCHLQMFVLVDRSE